MTLEQLNLRETDNIYVYELCDTFEEFVTDHYTFVKDITKKKFKEKQFIDCKIQEKVKKKDKIKEKDTFKIKKDNT